MMSNSDRIDKFDEQARRVFHYAQEEAQSRQHNYIGTEHLLLGLIHDENTTAVTILRNLDIDLVKVRDSVVFIISSGDRVLTGPAIGLTPRGKKVIELAVDEARRLNNHYIGIEHLLLGMIREGEGIAAGVLESVGVNLEKARMETVRILQTKEQTTDVTHNNTSSTPSATHVPTQETTGVPRSEHVALVQTHSLKPYADYPFTEQANKVLEGAREEALRFQHNYIGTEHLLLGMVRDSDGVAGTVLQNLGVQLHRARKAIEFIIGRGDRVVLSEIGLTPRSKKILRLASEEAERMNNAYIGTEHLLLGMMLENEGIAAGVLHSMGIELSGVRAETLRVLQNAKHEA